MTESETSTLVGIDIGGTFTRIAVVDTRGRVLADRRTETPKDGEELIRWLDSAYHTCRDETDSLPAPNSIGVGVPGVLEPGRSAVISSINLPFIEGLPIRDMLIERTGARVWVDCDTVAAAWGEYCCRNSTTVNGLSAEDPQQSTTRFAYLTIGTGVGAAVIIDSEILRHTHHSIGHWGQTICDTTNLVLNPSGILRGSLEAIVSAPAIINAASEVGLGRSLTDLEIELQEGDAAATGFVETLARTLAVAFVNLTHLYAIDLLVVGGGVALGLPSLIRRAGEISKKMTAGDSVVSCAPMGVELCALADYSGVVGAALLAAKQFENRAPE